MLTLSDLKFGQFLFDLFDKDNFGILTIQEITELINLICGINSESSKKLTSEILRLNLIHTEEYTFNQFFSLIMNQPVLLYPAYKVRDKLRTFTLGAQRWHEIVKIRAKKFGEFAVLDIFGSLRTKPSGCTDRDLR